MAANSFTEVTRESWLSRIGNAVGGVLFGILLFLGSFVLLFFNEGRAVKTRKALEEGGGQVVTVEASKIVHLTALATTDETLRDKTFGVETEAIKLRRDAEMYQWQERVETEKKKNLGGSEDTYKTYHYDKVWSAQRISSANFHKSAEFPNPDSMPYQSETWSAKQVEIGDFRLSNSLRDKINDWEALSADAEKGVPESLGDDVRLEGGGFYIGSDPSAPEIGDMRIRFSQVPPTEISLAAVQVKDSFEPYRAANGREIELLQTGTHSAEAMFEKAKSDNHLLTWILRVVGFIVMAVGLGLILKPLSVLADVVPFIGNLVEAGTGIISAGIAAVLSMLTIAIAWVFYRPVLGIALLAVAVAIAVGVGMKLGKAKAKRQLRHQVA